MPLSDEEREKYRKRAGLTDHDITNLEMADAMGAAAGQAFHGLGHPFADEVDRSYGKAGTCPWRWKG